MAACLHRSESSLFTDSRATQTPEWPSSIMLVACVCVFCVGFDLHRCQPCGVCRALLEPWTHEAGGRSRSPHRADVLCQCALPHCQGHL
ncbi:hypothetical protein XENOCAPTIV_010595 [Xenoophorus captivus]|uniref:Uncharacterized protein n=1 Tax=Xenoophorus captivus TaxID=1517983 RepID=A0ABV0S1L6_9TELE